MASKGATVKVSFIGDATQFRQVVQQIQQDADKVEQSSGKFGALGGAITKLGIAAAGIGGFVALKGALTDAVDAANESARVAAQTEAALKSTGGAAGVSAQQVGDLATALSKVAPFDDEVIQSGENLLLTFTNVKNAAGQGNDIFNQTTKIALDMSTALGTDLNSSVLQLGKALDRKSVV